MRIAVSEVLSLLKVDTEGGRCFWIKPPKNHPQLKEKEAGTRQRRGGRRNDEVGYWVIRIYKRSYKRAHIVFAAIHGRWPMLLDHIDGNSLNDSGLNLREVTITQNNWNHRHRAKSTNLPMGIRKMGNSYQARIALNKKTLHLGTFPTPEQAHSVYIAKRREVYGEFAGVEDSYAAN